MGLLVLFALLFLLIRVSPSPFPDPKHTEDHPHSIRFVPVPINIQACELTHLRRFLHLSSRLSPTSRKLTPFFWLIILAGDVEMNPGPNWKYTLAGHAPNLLNQTNPASYVKFV